MALQNETVIRYTALRWAGRGLEDQVTLFEEGSVRYRSAEEMLTES